MSPDHSGVGGLYRGRDELPCLQRDFVPSRTQLRGVRILFAGKEALSDLTHAETSLREAQSAIEASGKLVKIQTEFPRGPAGPVLVEASRDAETICVGSLGIGPYARSILGSVATELAEEAHCPVAVIRTDSDLALPDVNWIVVRMTDAPRQRRRRRTCCARGEVTPSAFSSRSSAPRRPIS